MSAASATAQPVERLNIQARQAEAAFPLNDVATGIYLLPTSAGQGMARQRMVVTH